MSILYQLLANLGTSTFPEHRTKLQKLQKNPSFSTDYSKSSMAACPPVPLWHSSWQKNISKLLFSVIFRKDPKTWKVMLWLKSSIKYQTQFILSDFSRNINAQSSMLVHYFLFCQRPLNKHKPAICTKSIRGICTPRTNFPQHFTLDWRQHCYYRLQNDFAVFMWQYLESV